MPELDETEAAEAVVEERSGISIVWLVPVVAAVIGAWLAYVAISERGPAITITFQSASGLEAEKTKVRYKDVEIGQVESIVLSEDLGRVEVSARLSPGSARFLTDKTRFWVVRARISAGQVSGLGTLFSGAYIGIDPSSEGERTRHFVGLERPPAFTSDEPGRVFTLRGDSLGSLEVGSPVYFRWLSVGRVVGYQLGEDADHVIVQVFVSAPHDQRVRNNTKFWNASGVDVSMSPEGFEIDTVSLTSMLIGGVAFDTPPLATSEPVSDDTVFPLYANKRATKRPVITAKRPFLLHFEQSARGLAPGSPVDFRGIVIGQVRSVHLDFDQDLARPTIPVVIDIEPERIAVFSLEEQDRRRHANWDAMVAQGLRAQLTTYNLLTGQLAVSFDFHPNAPSATIDWDQPIPEVPTIPSPIEELKAGLGEFMAKLNSVPLKSIGKGMESSLKRLDAVLADLEQATPALTGTLKNAESTLASIDKLVAPDSQASADLKRALRELADAARSLRLLAEELEQNPESLIRGKQ